MYKVVDVIEGLDESEQEKTKFDPMIVLLALAAILLVIGFFFQSAVTSSFQWMANLIDSSLSLLRGG